MRINIGDLFVLLDTELYYVKDIEYDEDKKELIPLQEKVKDFLQNFDDEFYESVFGSHAEVTVTKDQIKIKEYTNHD